MPSKFNGFQKDCARNGFTIIELMIGLVVAMVAIAAVYSVYTVQQRHFSNQQLVLTARQNLRGAIMVLEQELRMVGYDPEDSGGFGLVDVRRYDPVNTWDLNPDGQPVLFYTCDVNEDGFLDDNTDGNENKGLVGSTKVRNKEHPRIRISDIHKDGHICLTWDVGSGKYPLAENIQAIGFAYAVDVDGDGYADRGAGSDHLIWAVDSDNDNLLDNNIDTNGDGLVNEQDDANGDNKIDMADGGALDSPVPLDRVKAVRVWVLAATLGPLRGDSDNRTQVVGDRLFKPSADGLKRFVLETSVQCRNL
jgi:type IV pilus assembly protein PilW